MNHTHHIHVIGGKAVAVTVIRKTNQPLTTTTNHYEY